MPPTGWNHLHRKRFEASTYLLKENPYAIAKLVAAVALTAGAALLAGCSSSAVPFDEVQEITFSEPDYGTEATLGLSIVDATVEDPSVVEELGMFGGSDAYEIPVFVTVNVTLIDGEVGADDVSTLNGRGWHGKGEDGKAAQGLNIIGVFEPCDGFNRDAIAELSETGSTEICTVLLAQTDAEMNSVGFGSKDWSR